MHDSHLLLSPIVIEKKWQSRQKKIHNDRWVSGKIPAKISNAIHFLFICGASLLLAIVVILFDHIGGLLGY